MRLTILLGSLDIVDGARTANNDQAIVSAIEGGTAGGAGGEDGGAGLGGQRDLLLETGGGKKGTNVADAGILSALLKDEVRCRGWWQGSATWCIVGQRLRSWRQPTVEGSGLISWLSIGRFFFLSSPLAAELSPLPFPT